jgi:hypothetical protein
VRQKKLLLICYSGVKSVYNITRERGWRSIWEKELGNVAHEYQIGRTAVGFVEADPIRMCYLQFSKFCGRGAELKFVVQYLVGFGAQLSN